jgi:hypothetical protein
MANVFVLESRNSEYWEEFMNRKTAGRALSSTLPIVVKTPLRPKKIIPMFAPIPPPSHIFLAHLSHFTAIVTVIQVLWLGYANVVSAGVLSRLTGVLLHPFRCPAWHPVAIGVLFTCCIGQGIFIWRRV